MTDLSKKDTFRIVHYVNQFFGGIGGEEHAYFEPQIIDGPKGPGRLLERTFLEQNVPAEIVATVICGDSYFSENEEEVLEVIIPEIVGLSPDLVVAGPAFNAGRYGMASGAVCKALNESGIPAITAMNRENPGVDQYRQSVLIIECAANVTGMEDAVRKMVHLGVKLLRGEDIVIPQDEGCFEQGLRKNYFHFDPAYQRAIKTLLQKVRGDSFETEYPIPFFDRVDPQPAISELRGIKVAMITSGGMVPTGNPDHIESSNASRYGRYPLGGVEKLDSRTHQSAHGGYDNTYANNDPNRVLPTDMMSELEKEMGFTQYEWYYSTVGNGTSVDSAQKFAKEIAVDLIRDGVQAVILTST